MKLFRICLIVTLLVGMANAIPLGSSARSCIPADLLQLISVDYRALKDSPTATAMKQQLMPENIKEFEAALKSIGLDPEKDVDSLVFASFREGKQGVKTIGIASGPFRMKLILKKMKLQNYKPKKYGTAQIYPMDGGFVMSFLDDSTLLFGDSTSTHFAIDTLDGSQLSLDTNGNIADMMTNVDSFPVWSILDQQGTQNMMHSAMGDTSKVPDYENLKKRLLGSRYAMDFNGGVNFDMTVVTADAPTAATVTSAMKGYMLFKKVSASPAEKVAVENTTVDSDGSNVNMHFKASDQQFQSLMHSELFAAVTH
jgi:hypothetical protein